MLSLETARELKEAGLEWEPQFGDFYYTYHNALAVAEKTYPCGNEWVTIRHEIMTFAPRLDQLLAEIERRGYGYELGKAGARNKRRYRLLLYEWDEEMAEIDFGCGWMPT